MSKVEETIKYYLDNIDTLFNADTDEWFEPLAEFVGTGICDGYCALTGTDECSLVCSLYHAMSTLKTEPTLENLNGVKSLVCQKLHEKLGG